MGAENIVDAKVNMASREGWTNSWNRNPLRITRYTEPMFSSRSLLSWMLGEYYRKVCCRYLQFACFFFSFSWSIAFHFYKYSLCNSYESTCLILHSNYKHSTSIRTNANQKVNLKWTLPSIIITPYYKTHIPILDFPQPCSDNTRGLICQLALYWCRGTGTDGAFDVNTFNACGIVFTLFSQRRTNSHLNSIRVFAICSETVTTAITTQRCYMVWNQHDKRAGYKAETSADDCASSAYAEKYFISPGVAMSLYLRENSLPLRLLLHASSAL